MSAKFKRNLKLENLHIKKLDNDSLRTIASSHVPVNRSFRKIREPCRSGAEMRRKLISGCENRRRCRDRRGSGGGMRGEEATWRASRAARGSTSPGRSDREPGGCFARRVPSRGGHGR